MAEGKFDIAEFFASDINEILEARKRSFSIHHTKDIRTAGDEVEETVRRVLASHLPSIYHIGHGHLVGPDGTTSPQLDVMISDARTNTVLFRAKNGSEYLPFGAAGVIGEVKSTYQKSKKYIEDFIETLTMMGNISPEIPDSSNYNALTFMLFVNSGDFKIEDVEEIFERTSDSNLPHMLYFLDKGVKYNAGHYEDSETGINLHNINVITSKNVFHNRRRREVELKRGTIMGKLYLCKKIEKLTLPTRLTSSGNSLCHTSLHLVQLVVPKSGTGAN